MAKARTAYLCSDCGAHSVKWVGQCPDCGAWNTLSETTISIPVKAQGAGASVTRLDALPEDIEARHATGFDEFDRVLGGGLVPGAVTLLGGDPGVGKSTLLQQVSSSLMQDLTVCYATGEESLRQVGQRSLRLGLDASAMNLLADTVLENVLEQARKCKARVLVIDSIQTMTCNDLPSAPGSVAQLREGVGRIVQFAKQNEVSVFVIGHVTKEGAIAGPRVVEHMVDTVLYFESDPRPGFGKLTIRPLSFCHASPSMSRGVLFPLRGKAVAHCSWKSRHSSQMAVETTRNDWLRVSIRIDWHCCWQFCSAMVVCRLATRTSL
jgi:DNA repair protein RadA/Sms